MEYTEKYHASRLIKILEKTDTCNLCPASHYFNPDCGDPNYINDPCNVCKKFINLNKNYNCCPCRALGQKECFKQSWIALEEKNYLT